MHCFHCKRSRKIDVVVLIFFSFFAFLPAISAICYYPDGSTSPQDVPCSDTIGPSNCCGPEYECLSNKICRKTHTNPDNSFANFTYGRGACTDQTWRASQCPSFCLTQWSGMLTTGHDAINLRSLCVILTDLAVEIAIYKCPNTTSDSYCCQAQDGSLGNCDCSATAGLTRPLHFEGTPSILTTIGVTGSTTSTTSTTPSVTTTAHSTTSTLAPIISPSTAESTLSTHTNTSSSAPQIAQTSSSSPPSSSPQPSSNRSAVIGAGVGVPLGVITSVVLAAVIYRRLRQRKAARDFEELAHDKDLAFINQAHGKAHHELLASTGGHELSAPPAQHELPVIPPEFPGETRHHELP